ncbi:hypothetical protein [Granulicella aggregans]|uniref:hypothetical protein n=1 Tax=Granulicella aggregans TaxID=474949 RepID=UPI0021E0E659|nr:hypothetical protein [Granulicella aggregans]
MARVSLQIKNVTSILLAAAASASSGITVKMYLDHKSWAFPAVCLAVALSCQLGLIFVESKEEEELSLTRKQRLEAVKAEIAEDRALTVRIQHEIEVGDPEAAARWIRFRKDKDGKHDLHRE